MSYSKIELDTALAVMQSYNDPDQQADRIAMHLNWPLERAATLRDYMQQHYFYALERSRHNYAPGQAPHIPPMPINWRLIRLGGIVALWLSGFVLMGISDGALPWAGIGMLLVVGGMVIMFITSTGSGRRGSGISYDGGDGGGEDGGGD
jgi:hypothetical protein